MYDASSWKSDNKGNPTLYMHTNSYLGNTFKTLTRTMPEIPTNS